MDTASAVFQYRARPSGAWRSGFQAGQRVGIVVLGGAALNLLGVVDRPTRDVDVLALARGPRSRLVRPDPLPPLLVSAAQRVAQALGAAEHRVIRIDLTAFGGSALTDDAIDVPDAPSEGIPVTYVPARNTVFLSMALAWAEVLESCDIFIGVNAVDYSGYPDCRPAFYHAWNEAVRAGTRAADIEVVAPLIHLSKADIVRLGLELDAPFDLTWSCYTREDWACGVCESCVLRLRAFAAAGAEDPIPYATRPSPVASM